MAWEVYGIKAPVFGLISRVFGRSVRKWGVKVFFYERRRRNEELTYRCCCLQIAADWVVGIPEEGA